MQYVCKICGYVYDDAKENVPFSELPDEWVCPLCGAKKSDFEAKDSAQKPEKPVLKKTAAYFDPDLKRLSAGQLSALCSNLAKGCEKQYKQHQADLFMELSEYFASVAPEGEVGDLSDIAKLLQQDSETGYGAIRETAGNVPDRGALRVTVWGEKVTKILQALMSRYEREGEAFLANTSVWVCTVCGFVYVGDDPPELCPVCKVPAWKFEKIEGRKNA